jgi:tRNA threonylcarbamoyladenosine biosynthesis protein TsaE
MKYLSNSLETTAKKAEEFVATLAPNSKATVVGLYGDLGSGKTTFTQAVAKILGVTGTVTSPTFIIEKIYHLSQKNFKHLIHIDAYRLEKSEELTKLGWQEIIDNPENLIFIEWPERVANILPPDIKKINFAFIDETTREIDIV